MNSDVYTDTMRAILSLLLLSPPAVAWEFTSDPICTIWHSEPSAEMVVTFDPRHEKPYAITVELTTGQWPGGEPFSIRFEGLRTFTISTNLHELSDDRRTVRAADTGFDNVLDGLKFNLLATSFIGVESATTDLTGAASVVQRFRDCTVMGLS